MRFDRLHARIRQPSTSQRGAPGRDLRRAARAAAAALQSRGELRPRELARIVVANVAPDTAAWLWRRLTRLDGLNAAARVPCDVLERTELGAGRSAERLALLRLALFGPGGQGHTEHKLRQAFFAQISSELMREGSDEKSLALAAQRAMRHPEVQRDSELAAMVRASICERESDLRLRRDFAPPAAANVHPWQQRDVAPPEERGAPSEGQVRKAFERLRHEFDDRLVRFELDRARETYMRIEEFQSRYPDVVGDAAVGRCRVDLARVEKRREQFEQEVCQLADQAVEAARVGDHDKAARALRRLSSIHGARPSLLPVARFQEIQQRIGQGGEQFEHREAARELLARERAVADEIRRLAEGVHGFHDIARRVPHTDPRYAQAEAEYRRLVHEVRSHDREWLADLMIELDEMLEDLHDPTGRAEAQVERFLASVRSTLVHTVAEIRAIAGKEGPAGG